MLRLLVLPSLRGKPSSASAVRPGDLHSGAGNGWSRNAAPTPPGVNHATPPLRPGLVKARGQERASKPRGSFQNFRLPSAKRGWSSCQSARLPENSGLNTGGCASASSSRLPAAPAIHATSLRTKARVSGARKLSRVSPVRLKIEQGGRDGDKMTGSLQFGEEQRSAVADL